MILVRIFFCFVIVTIGCLAQEDKERIPFFRRDYVYSKELNAFYKFHATRRKWSDALATCKGEGAEFFIPKSKEELDYVQRLADNKQLWLATHDKFSPGDFITLDGKPLSQSYVKWRAGEPNNLNNNEHCAIVEAIGEYTDVPCDHDHASICKRTTQNLSQNIICETHDQEFVYTSQTDRCYKFHTTPMTWHQAYKTCQSEEAYLTIINSDGEAKILTLMFAKYPERSLKGNFDKNALHVGFNDLLTNGIYLTTEGQSLSEAGYENWNFNQPDNYQGQEHCGSMFRDGTLNDINCEMRALFVCEKQLSSSGNNPNALAKLPDEQ